MSKTSSHPLGGEKQLSCDAIVQQFRFLEGKVLTIIDASYPNDTQRKAVKDLARSAFDNQMSWVSQLCYPNVQMWSQGQIESSGVDIEKVIAEAEEAK